MIFSNTACVCNEMGMAAATLLRAAEDADLLGDETSWP